MPYIGYTIIILICVGLIYLTLTNKSKHFPYFLYTSALAMILLTTLAGPHLVGSDIHMEFFYAQHYANNGQAGPILFYVPQGTSIANNIIAPALPWSLLWTYKLFFPMVFATTPVMLYHIAQTWLDKRRALLASFVFISFTPFFMEIPTIARQMLAEVFLVGCLLLIVQNKFRWYPQLYILLSISAALIPLNHYSIAVVALIIFGLGLLVSLTLKQLRVPILIVFLSILITSAAYYPFVQDGAVLRKIGHLYNSYAPIELRLTNPVFELQELPTHAIPSEPDARVNVVREPDLNKSDPDLPVFAGLKNKTFYERYDTITSIALGGDFLQTNWLGKTYRIVQWLILLLIFPGLWKLRRNKNYWVLAIGFGLITVMSIVPGWANVLNMTRFLHLSLIMASIPIALSIRPKYLTPLLVVYFLLSSGFMFEITKQPDIESLTAPYNVGLSDHRMDLGATITKDDLIVRDYVFENKLYPINSDIYGAYIMIQRIGPVGPRADLNIALPKTPQPLIDGYIFVRSRNTQDGTFVLWRNIGLRTYWPLEDWSVDEDSEVVFQSGDAKVVRVRPIEKRLEPSKPEPILVPLDTDALRKAGYID